LITFLHLSDFHILPRRGDLRDGGDPCRKVERVIEVVREMELNPSFSIITGDLAQDGEATGYDLVKGHISEIEALGGPVFPVVGNVDGRDNFRRILLGESGVDGGKPCYYSQTVEGFNVVVLDSQTPGSGRGSLDEEQLAWLEEELQGCDKPSIIALHHPIFRLPYPMSPESASYIFDPEHAQRFREIVSEVDVLAVLCGHLHHNLVTSYDGIQCILGSSTLSEMSIIGRYYNLYDASGFNVLTYHNGVLTVRPIAYSEGRKLIKKQDFPYVHPVERTGKNGKKVSS
jgi:3',5'-cyclic AMP phosphodiesterase CpdA